MSAFMTLSDNGIQGYTASPGEGTCSSCHGGGFSSSSSTTFNSFPAFSINQNGDAEFMPDSVYQIDVVLNASGFSKFGFAAQILSSSLVNSGTLQAAGSGVKFLNAGQKRTAVHNTPKTAAANTATFTFHWKAPHQGDATLYAIGNAVNGNGSTSGDYVMSPASMALVAAPAPVDTTITTGLLMQKNPEPVEWHLFPNPCNTFCQLSYQLAATSNVNLELYDLHGKKVMTLVQEQQMAGNYSQTIQLGQLPDGVYLVKSSSEGKVSCKRLLVQH